MSDVVILTTKLKEERDYWLTKLSREIGASSLPLDFNRSKVYAEKRAAVDVSLPAAVSQRLEKMTGNSPFLLYTILMAALKACLHKYTGSSTIVVGSPAYRRDEETNGQAGPLVMVGDINERQTFREFLMTVRETLSEAYARQSYPLNTLVKELEVEPVENKCPLFDIALVLKEIHHELPHVKNDITMVFEKSSGAVAGSIFYNARLYRRETIARFAGHFVNVLRSAVENVNTPISALEMLSPAERNQILREWNNTTAVYPSDLCLHQLFEAQATKTPDAIAIAFGETRLTYSELNRRANQLARHLRGLGIGADARVGLMLERSTEMMVGLLGILKAGGAYVPLDPTFPEQRLSFTLEDGKIEVLLTQQRLAGKFPARTVICLDSGWETIAQQSSENLSAQVASPDNLAYVLYTSGSTGQPKGVMMNHRPLVNLISWQVAQSANVPETRTLQFSSLGFDVSFQEIFSTWCAGGTLVLVEEQVRRDAMALWQYLADEKIERLFAPFIVLQQLAEVAGVQEETVPSQLREFCTAGEQLQVTAAVVGMFRKLNGCTLYNHYGPTEGHVVSSFKLEDTPSRWPLLPAIGRPIANAELYVLDKHGQPTPAGVSGELHIGGVSLARGYLDRPSLTAEKFVPNPFSAEGGARLYKTGDLARFMPDGNIEILGRIDHQVKIRGFRVELGEIETALCAHTAIREAVTVVREDAPGEKRLVAYVVVHDGQAVTNADLRASLKDRLPEYMVPHVFVMLDSLPLTSSGKVDRRSLPAPDRSRPEQEAAFIEPRTKVEEILRNIWIEVLGVERIGINDNFFELGGDSILTIQVVARANREGLRLVPKMLFQHQTIAALAAVAGTTPTIEAQQSAVEGKLPLTPIQCWFFDQNLPEPHHFNMGYLFELRDAFTPSVWEASVKALLAHHDALRLRFSCEENGWRQSNATTDELVPFTHFDVSAIEATERAAFIKETAASLQSSLDLTAGPLMRVALFNSGAEEAARLLVVIHHLAVDGVSWRILLEDLQTAIEQSARGEAVKLPAKTTSFKQWAEKLEAYANTVEAREEMAYWLAEPRRHVAALPIDFEDGVGLESTADIVTVTLNVEETAALLRDIPKNHRLQINDVLLTALAEVVSQWSGGQSLLVDVEGHGREAVVADADVSRTVGWFTSMFPVLLELNGARTPGDALRTVKDQLRQIPNNGIGYGLLRYLSREPGIIEDFKSLPKAEVSFNYLGQSDQLFTENSLWRMGNGQIGKIAGSLGKLPHLLYVAGIIYQGQLHVRFKYSRDTFHIETINALSQIFINRLRALIDYCQTAEVYRYSPSDFPLAQLEADEFEKAFEQVEHEGDRRRARIEDAYPLSPAQEGILFHSLYESGGGVYVTQMSCDFRNLNVEAVERAWQAVIDRYPVLRTVFVWNNISKPHQVVAQDVTIPFRQEDWRGLPEHEQREKFDAFLLADRGNGFRLTSTPLMRLALFQVADDRHRFVWSHHHLLMDGWSIFLVLKELFVFYEAFSRGEELQLEPVHSYRDYIAWLQQRDLSEVEAFWRATLKGFTRPTPLGAEPDPATSHDEQEYAEQRVELSTEATAVLQTVARQNQLTLNTLVQGAWSLLLAHTSGDRDVMFGATASGRPTELEAIEEMVGLFINVCPMRVELPPEESLRVWLKNLQAAQFRVREFEYTPLVQVQRWSEVPRGMPLFKSILSFENYPVDDSIREHSRNLEISDVRNSSRTNYPATLIVAPRAALAARLVYNCKLFDAATIKRLLAQLFTLLENFSTHLDEPISKLDEVLAGNEKSQKVSEQRQHEQRNLKRFKSIKPKTVSLPQGELIKTEPLYPGQPLPLVVRPAVANVNLADWAKGNRELVEQMLHRHGALLFRGFETETVEKFEQFATAICSDLFGEYGDLPREGVGGKVYGSTPYPSDKAILPHNESSHLHRWPLRIFFYCVKAAHEGGETPIIDCQKLYRILDPKIRERLSEKRLMYVRNYTDGLDVSWQTFFRTDSRAVVEDYCKAASIDFEWRENDVLRTRQIRPAVAQHPKTGDAVFFNQLQLHHISCLEPDVRDSLRATFREEDFPRNVYYGDGSPIEEDIIEEIREASRQSETRFPWQPGDILMLDNMLAAHGRRPYKGQRKIVVAMGEMITNRDIHFSVD